MTSFRILVSWGSKLPEPLTSVLLLDLNWEKRLLSRWLGSFMILRALFLQRFLLISFRHYRASPIVWCNSRNSFASEVNSLCPASLTAESVCSAEVRHPVIWTQRYFKLSTLAIEDLLILRGVALSLLLLKVHYQMFRSRLSSWHQPVGFSASFGWHFHCYLWSLSCWLGWFYTFFEVQSEYLVFWLWSIGNNLTTYRLLFQVCFLSQYL